MTYAPVVDRQQLLQLDDRRSVVGEMLAQALAKAQSICTLAAQVRRDVAHTRKAIPLNAAQARQARTDNMLLDA